ncbi:hypothetical protein CLTEP_24660 [Clostridium tepidiprofundi DSM 19306]|uniref:SdpI/YhfL protein family protein n=1 Tax=Clostridium tepidiprofundi DSM 19306 TaxID=1121338 RepID=A0A151ATF1_9CLOT|nr:SdpI family protein [Clostridium tepidiprofundi]KYH30944.1 hypothetical protein CLTEP_24660 [Clostridium tepidiprofundi DSM 19306]
MKDIIFSYVICLATPLVMLVGGIICKNVKLKINHFVGYRTKTSMRNEDTWKFANHYLGKLWIIIGLLMTIFSSILLTYIYSKTGKISGMLCLGFIISQSLVVLISVFSVEKKLKEKFNTSADKTK